MKVNRKHQILDAAFTLFTKNGYDKTSLADLAKLAGVPVGCIYYHFNTKQLILEEMLKHNNNEVTQKIQENLNCYTLRELQIARLSAEVKELYADTRTDKTKSFYAQ